MRTQQALSLCQHYDNEYNCVADQHKTINVEVVDLLAILDRVNREHINQNGGCVDQKDFEDCQTTDQSKVASLFRKSCHKLLFAQNS